MRENMASVGKLDTDSSSGYCRMTTENERLGSLCDLHGGLERVVIEERCSMHTIHGPQETHTLCVFDRLPVVSWRRAKYKQMYELKSTLTVSG